MSKRAYKRPHEQAIRTTISLPPPLFDAAHEIMRVEFYSDFSTMLQSLIRERKRQLDQMMKQVSPTPARS